MADKRKIPLRQAVVYIGLSICLISGSATLAWCWYQYILSARKEESKYTITALIQTGRKDSLACWQLEELLDLSKDRPENFYAFDTKAATKKLEALSLFKKAHVRKVRPNMVHVDYELRSPRIRIADFENVGCDAEGYCFPLTPFFSQRELVEVFLGIDKVSWDSPLHSQQVDLAFGIIDATTRLFLPSLQLERVDVSRFSAASCGQKEIVLRCRYGAKTIFVRLLPQDAYLRLQDLVRIQNLLDKQEAVRLVVDLRCPKIGLLKY